MTNYATEETTGAKCYSRRKIWVIEGELRCKCHGMLTREMFGSLCLQDVLSEMAQLFQRSPHIHIGGDEVSTAQWAQSAVAQQVARDNNIDVSNLEGALTRLVTQMSSNLNVHVFVHILCLL